MPSSCEAKLGRLVAASAAALGEALAEALNACASDARPSATTKRTFIAKNRSLGALRRSARSPRGREQTQVGPALTLTDLLKVPATAPSPAPPANPYSSTLRWARPTASSRPSEPQGAEGSRRRPTYSAVYRRVDNSAQTHAIVVISSPGLPLDTQWCRELIPALVLRLVPRRLPCALRQSSVCTHSCAQTINNNMPRGQNSQVILRQRPAAPPCGASRLARLIPVSDAAARRETRTTRPVALTATAAPRTTTRTATDPTTTLTTTGRLTTTRPHRRRLRRCTPLLLRSKVPSRLEKFAGCSLEFGPYPQFRH